MKIMKIIIKVLAILIFIPATLLILGIGVPMWSNAHPEIGENVKTVRWLPPEATNISYYKTISKIAYEFDISESGFKKYAEGKGWTLQPIKEPIKITRYAFFTSSSHSSDPTGEKYKEYQSKVDIRIKNGYYYTTPPQPNGGGLHVGYDLDTGRAYYQMNLR